MTLARRVTPCGSHLAEVIAHRLLRRRRVVGRDRVMDATVHLDHQPPLVAPSREVAPPHLDQHLPDRVVQHKEQVVVGGRGDRAVELEVDLDAGLKVRALVFESDDGVVDVGNILGRGAFRGQSGGGHLQHAADLVHLAVVHHAAPHEVVHRVADGLGVGGHDPHPAAALDLEQSARGERAHRLPDHRPRDAELLPQLALGGQRIARLEVVGRDHLEDRIGDLVRQPSIAFDGAKDGRIVAVGTSFDPANLARNLALRAVG